MLAEKARNSGLTPAEFADKNRPYERLGKGVLAAGACIFLGPTACVNAVKAIGVGAGISFATNKPITNLDVISGGYFGAAGGEYARTLQGWAASGGAAPSGINKKNPRCFLGSGKIWSDLRWQSDGQ
ncbi:hypothetical protein [Crenobacter cavernae]|uniref:hypothetical protein n=1 Tax=Crenobacter cavernae TaxID=2290923 RepID=UPI00100F5590|nr:hypothetical protein [Crenobacter cavernae]